MIASGSETEGHSAEVLLGETFVHSLWPSELRSNRSHWKEGTALERRNWVLGGLRPCIWEVGGLFAVQTQPAQGGCSLSIL